MPDFQSTSGRVSLVLVGAVVVLAVLVLVGGLMVVGAKNGAVEKDEAVTSAWANVQASYQRRLDLVPNLVETVKGAASFEQETLTAVTEARASVGRMSMDPKEILDNPELMKQFASAQGTLGGALQRLLVVTERYPELRATQNFADLQNQLEGTENRINQARRDFNEAVKDYNAHVRKIPNKWFLDETEFPPRVPFEATPAAAEAPAVNFGDG